MANVAVVVVVRVSIDHQAVRGRWLELRHQQTQLLWWRRLEGATLQNNATLASLTRLCGVGGSSPLFPFAPSVLLSLETYGKEGEKYIKRGKSHRDAIDIFECLDVSH